MAPYSVEMRENTDQKNFEYGHFLHSVDHQKCQLFEDYLTLNGPIPDKVKKLS